MNTPLYTRCLRCGRALRDHKSKSRGYGPECWEKVRHALPPYRAPLSETKSLINPFDASASYLSILRKFSSHSCPSCGASLHSAEVHSYDHDNGINLSGFLLPQWVYITCPCCGVDISLHKLTRDSCGDLCKNYRQVSISEILGFYGEAV
ncbi:DUF6011 domain-containing protein [Methanosarcina acetivorans]|uniref:Uncharacterized protein n=1 Tax=Methanosarcina acetivorans (strain ATCC 35395 / DSM 2834 / JCM 12185 / C2A) TaxID=188937 RepID=Q8TMP8_METAC|nr:DUF6011 domain-containing protein [Methanosarcina acetivorans]AAM05986.1 predicted protein [Methanosarcina acetivorans C2A]